MHVGLSFVGQLTDSARSFSALFLVKAYVELYEGKMRKKAVNYATFRQTTHLVIYLWLQSSICFMVGLWPHYGWNTPILLTMFGFGVVLQAMLLIPNTMIQNALAFVLMTFFLQQYSHM